MKDESSLGKIIEKVLFIESKTIMLKCLRRWWGFLQLESFLFKRFWEWFAEFKDSYIFPLMLYSRYQVLDAWIIQRFHVAAAAGGIFLTF